MKRYLFNDIKQLALSRGKIAFISGPRQVGKTTLSKSYAQEFNEFQYKNWDESEFRRLWTKSPNQIEREFNFAEQKNTRLLILDEIHKSKNWKQKLKGLYDTIGQHLSIIVTGSARLNIFKKGSDSLMGRYLNFRLHPLSFGELTGLNPLAPEEWKLSLNKKNNRNFDQEPLIKLFDWSGFPEPYFASSDKIHRIWRKDRTEKIVREDLRDLSRLPELSQVEMLTSLLPSKVGSPLSVQSLREDLEVAHGTVTRWLKYLNELFYFFEIRPWSKSIPRSLKKDAKIYLYDWTEVEEQGPRFENLVASHLLKACHYWTDTGEGSFSLHYLRNKEKQEIDFLIVKDKKPWLCVEAKYSSTQIDFKNFKNLLKSVKCPLVQVVFREGIFLEKDDCLVISANRFFERLP